MRCGLLTATVWILPIATAGAVESDTKEKPPAAGGVERHYLVTYQGKPISVIHERETRSTYEGRTVVLVSSRETVRLRRDGATIEQSVKRERIEELDGTLLVYYESQEDRGQRTELIAKREAKQFVFTTRLYVGNELASSKVVKRDLPGRVVHELDGRALARAGKLRVGERMEAYVLAPDQLGIAHLQAEVIGRRTKGRTEAFLVEVRNAGAKPGADAWQFLVDGSGELIDLQAGPGVVRRRVSAAEARLPRRAAAVSGRVSTDRRLQGVERIEQLQIAFRLPAGGAARAAISTVGAPYQSVRAGPDGEEVVVALSASWPDGRLPPAALTDKDRARHLAPSLHVQSSHDEIRRLARRVTDGHRSEMRRAYAITKWVYENLDKRPIGPANGSAVEAARAGAGDCTEHTALAAALARASGIPARTASGLVWESGAFQFHAWTEMHLSGRWVPVDATLGRFGLPALYLKFADPADDPDSIPRPAWVLALPSGGGVRVLGVRHAPSAAGN